MLLVLLALVLPTAALASTISFTIGPCFFNIGFNPLGPNPPETQTFFGAIVEGAFASDITVSGNGKLIGTNVMEITSGTLQVSNSSGMPFQNSIAGGEVRIITSVDGFPIFTARGSLKPNSSIGNGSFVLRLSTNPVIMSFGSVTATTTPEPGTLLTFGTGLIGLAEMARRKLKLGT